MGATEQVLFARYRVVGSGRYCNPIFSTPGNRIIVDYVTICRDGSIEVVYGST